MIDRDIVEDFAMFISIEDKVTDKPQEGVIFCNCDRIPDPIGNNLGLELLFCNEFYFIFSQWKG